MVVRDHPFLHLLSQVIRPGIFICRDENVISDMQNITKAEVIYSLTKGRGQFADLATLAEVELIDPAFASGERDGCLFVLKAEAMPGRRAVYEVSAKPKSADELRTGNHTFYSNETVGPEIYELEGTEQPRVTMEDREPKVGLPVGTARKPS